MWGFRSSTLANIFLLLLVAMSFSVNHVSAAKQFQNETDRLALLEFKNQIYDDPLGVLNSWNHSQHHCQWEGVTCSARHQRVIALILGHKQLSGTISPQVGNLSFMRFIHLEENQFHGEIPREFGRLFRLRVLNLSSNALGGKIPANLSYCSEMTTINLKMNKLEGKIPIDQLSRLKKLERINLLSNNLTGEIPSSIGNLSSLIQIKLDFNNLEGNLPMEIGLLKRLTSLDVTGNKLSGVIPASVFNSSAITIFSVADNSFHGKPPTNVGLTLPNLEGLYLGANEFYGNFPTSITNASGLEILGLSNNNFAGQIPANLGDLTQLQRLNLDANLFGNNSSGDLDFIVSLSNCSNLSDIDLTANNFGGNIPKVMANLSDQLAGLDLGGNQLSGTIPEGFGNFVNLYRLGLHMNSLSGVIPRDFGKLQNLQGMRLDHNDLSGQLVSTLCNNTNLFYLDLSFNQFEGGNIFDNVLMDVSQNLQYLDVSQNNFTGIISPHFLQMHSLLRYLNLGKNSFNGSLPAEVGKLVNLVSFVVSHNQLAGDIPISLADCANLENLYMQANFFQGRIPPNLASLKSIQQLDLSSNNLTGPIPKELEKLQFLRYLNLSYNDIEGEVPNTGVFSNASQTSLIGNNKLCGGIPELEFSPCPLIKGKNRGKLKVIILLSIVLPATLLVLGALSLYFWVYQKKERRIVAGFSSMPSRIDELLRLSYHELLRATAGFSPENLIGSGNFGSVYKGRLEKHGNKLVAVKVLDLQKNGASKSFEAECKTLRNIRHRNLVSIVSYCSSIDSKGDEFKALVYELMENGNLDLWLHPETADKATSSRSLNLSQKLNIAIDVASALQYLQNHCEAEIVHCDLKPSNILLDNDLVAHVGDFGLARLLPKPINISSEQGTSSTIVIKGSIGYAAPEYGMGVAASTLGDVYSYGILLLEMITRKRPTDDMFMDEFDLHNFVKRALPGQVYEIVDPLLLSKADDEDTRMTPGGDKTYGGRETECVISLLKIGLKCSEKLPNDRMHMNEVVGKLHLIKDVFLGVRAYQKSLEA
ncbi:unnamed protein product [Coffea canephora]|uniref:non-specific serine/threonine protein kinase n=1 Tax=Coffea canephora TaxID=49390 RepID=A0A068VFH4_COFCA|nr:unnamed protein product [Coffea canephora]